ncbi:MAG: hypothetical protein JNL21_15045 [Myxococcales bacterium]|nr:hypothetical protein [Myxococcales bacterium]
MPRKAKTQPTVAVVAKSPETVDGLAAYLGNAGVTTRGSRSLESVRSLASGTAAVVLFPDEFASAGVLSAVRELRRNHPRVFLVVVTRQPHDLEPVLEADGRSTLPLVLPKPAFGWSILDALRANAPLAGDRE